MTQRESFKRAAMQQAFLDAHVAGGTLEQCWEVAIETYREALIAEIVVKLRYAIDGESTRDYTRGIEKAIEIVKEAGDL